MLLHGNGRSAPGARPYYSYNTAALRTASGWFIAGGGPLGGQETNEMATEPATETKTATKLKLDPPEALQPLAVQEAAGLVPLKDTETSELDQKVDKFVDELAALDSNSP